MPDATASDEELLAAWGGGDAQAGAWLVRRHFASVFRFFRTKLDTGVDELAQRTFLACLESRERFRGEGTFRAFLLGIARMQLLRFLQRERNKGPEELDPGRTTIRETLGYPSPSGVVAVREEHRFLLDAMRRLPIDLQLSLELHYWEDLSVGEIASILDIPSGTVKTRLHRARTRLREIMDGIEVSADVRQRTGGDLDGWARSLREAIDRQRSDS